MGSFYYTAIQAIRHATSRGLHERSRRFELADEMGKVDGRDVPDRLQLNSVVPMPDAAGGWGRSTQGKPPARHIRGPLYSPKKRRCDARCLQMLSRPFVLRNVLEGALRQRERSLEARVHSGHRRCRDRTDDAKDQRLFDRRQVLTLHGRGREKAGLPTFRRGEIEEELRWFVQRPMRGRRDHREDRIVQTAVVAIGLHNQSRPNLPCRPCRRGHP